jgi:hypothetical protein
VQRDASSFNQEVIVMSDVRMPIDKELDSTKRRHGANCFSDMLSHNSSSPNARATPYSLMADFIDDAFEDNKLSSNELEGMKVLAGLDPGARPAGPPTNVQPPPPEPMSPEEFMKEVGEKAITSKGGSSAESKMIDLATRLMHATLNQQQSFLGRLDDYIASDSEIDEAESHRLEAFVNDLLKPHCDDKKPPTYGGGEQPDQTRQRTTLERLDTRIDSWVDRGLIAPEVGALAKQM